jgi:ornithine cyclodeaminase/alanine dehydrogenase-like protein (mu-crystallin family)
VQGFVTLFDRSTGAPAAQDLFAAEYVLRNARRTGSGQSVDFP